MSRLTRTLQNDWRLFGDGGRIDLLRLTFDASAWRVAVGVKLLGFGIGLTYWKRAAREWEPIEHDGSCGMEHAP